MLAIVMAVMVFLLHHLFRNNTEMLTERVYEVDDA